MEEIDVAIFAFDGAGLRLLNRAGARVQRAPSQLLGRDAGRWPGLLEGETPRRMDGGFGHGEAEGGGCAVSVPARGLPHTLLVLADLRRVVREEERAA